MEFSIRLPAAGTWLRVALLFLAPYTIASTLTLEDLNRLSRLIDPVITADGSQIAVVRNQPDYQNNLYTTDLLLIDVASGNVRQLTHTRYGLGNAVFTPDSSALLFTALDNEKQAQIYRLPLAGGEAEQLTQVATGVATFAVSPDGSRIAFATRDEPVAPSDDARPGEEHNKAFVVGRDSYLAEEASRPLHLWLMPADGGETERLTSGDGGLVSFFGRSYHWSEDGRELLAVFKKLPHSAEWIDSHIEIVDTETTDRKRVYDPDFPIYGAGYTEDGRIFYSRADGPAAIFYPAAGFLLNGETSVPITEALDLNVRGFLPLPGGEDMLFAATEGTHVKAWAVSLADGATRALDLDGVYPHHHESGFSVSDDGLIAFVGSTADRADEVYVTRIEGKPRRVSDVNRFLDELELAETQSISWKSYDGMDVDGVVLVPPGHDPEKRYPLALKIHGGPMFASTEAFDLIGQLLAAKGLVVFLPNYRGSDNQGAAFQSAVINDAGDGPGRDVMAGVTHLLEQELVDPARMAVSGWSYGGFMTAWLASHFPDRWRAAVAGAPVVDWFDDYALSDMNVVFGPGLGGSPWKDQDTYERYSVNSPMRYLRGITAPTLILMNTGDERVPVTNGYKLFHALKGNDVPVKFVAYPIDGHFPQDPVHVRDVMRRWVGWLEEHLVE